MVKKNKKEIKKVTTWKQDIKALKEAKGGKLRKGKVSIDIMTILIDLKSTLSEFICAFNKLYSYPRFINLDKTKMKTIDNDIDYILNMSSEDILEYDLGISDEDDRISTKVLKSDNLSSYDKALIMLGYDSKECWYNATVVFTFTKEIVIDMTKLDKKIMEYIRPYDAYTFIFDMLTDDIYKTKITVVNFLSYISENIYYVFNITKDIDTKASLNDFISNIILNTITIDNKFDDEYTAFLCISDDIKINVNIKKYN